jgi:hypothetical protein
LHGKEDALHIDIEYRVKELLGDGADGAILRKAGIRNHDVELALFRFDLRKEAIKIASARHVSPHAGNVSSDLSNGGGQLRLATAGIKT